MNSRAPNITLQHYIDSGRPASDCAQRTRRGSAPAAQQGHQMRSGQASGMPGRLPRANLAGAWLMHWQAHCLAPESPEITCVDWVRKSDCAGRCLARKEDRKATMSCALDQPQSFNHGEGVGLQKKFLTLKPLQGFQCRHGHKNSFVARRRQLLFGFFCQAARSSGKAR